LGRKLHTIFPRQAELTAAARALKRAALIVGDFDETLRKATRGHLVYLDPPYPPLNGTSYFTHYTRDRFDSSNQQRLADAVYRLDRRGCYVMMTNADTPLVRHLYRGFVLHSLSVPRYVTCRSIKHHVDELVITNYVP
jgi:DNA adenine methylase